MRYIKSFLLIIIFTLNISAQENSFINSGNTNDWYIGPAIKFTPIKSQFAFMPGLRVGWILNNKLSFGGGFYSVLNKIDAPPGAMPVEIPLDIDFQYLGFETEYIFNDFDWGYIGFYNLIGGGAARYVKDEGSAFKSTQQHGETIFGIVIEPGVNTEFIISSWLHLNAALTYRLVIGIEKQNLKDRDFSGIDFTLCFKFSGI